MAYYSGLKPSDFWNGRYKDIYLYCEMYIIRLQDTFKQQVRLQDATTTKLIQADSMCNKHPKVIPLTDFFPSLFKKK